MIITFKMPLSLAKIIGQGKARGEVGLDHEAGKLKKHEILLSEVGLGEAPPRVPGGQPGSR